MVEKAGQLEKVRSVLGALSRKFLVVAIVCDKNVALITNNAKGL